jgi:serine/threonine protein kinase
MRFQWDEHTNENYRVFPADKAISLEHVARLGNKDRARAQVWASRTKKMHGFEDTVADKVVRYGNEAEKRAARTEVENLRKLDHNHIVKFLGYYVKGQVLGIIMFPVAACDLDIFLEAVEVDIELMRPWFSCLTRALQYLHNLEKPFKHRDIKPANILIDRYGSVFLTDFGISKQYSSQHDTLTKGDGRYTVKYAPPKMIDSTDEKQGLESDIFCLGCVFLEMATVILGKRLENMYDHISASTGLPASIEYHRDFIKAGPWASELCNSIKTQCDVDEYKQTMIDKSLPMFVRMINECAVGSGPFVKLDEVCEAVDPISPIPCEACRFHEIRVCNSLVVDVLRMLMRRSILPGQYRKISQ